MKNIMTNAAGDSQQNMQMQIPLYIHSVIFIFDRPDCLLGRTALESRWNKTLFQNAVFLKRFKILIIRNNNYLIACWKPHGKFLVCFLLGCFRKLIHLKEAE